MSRMDPEAEFKDLSRKLELAIEEVQRVGETNLAEMKKNGELSEAAKKAGDDAIVEMKKQSDRLTDIEQKLVRRPGAGGEDVVKSAGQKFVEDEKVKAFLATSDRRAFGGGINVSMERKNITSAATTVGTGTSPSNSLVRADRIEMVGLPMRNFFIRDLLAPGATSSNSIEFPVMISRTLNAAPVAEGALKPQSDVTFDLRTFSVRTIAHWFKASRQIMDDAPGLQSLIDAECRYGLDLLEETQLLYGDGTGQNLSGIIPQASVFNPAIYSIPGATNIDVIRQAILQATLNLYPATGIVMHPIDWAKIETTKDGQGRYIIGMPQGIIPPTLWGLPVVASLAMTPGNFVVGSFRYGAQIFDRMAIEVLLSTEDGDNFVRNMITIRAEERLTLVTKRPQSFIQGPFPPT